MNTIPEEKSNWTNDDIVKMLEIIIQRIKNGKCDIVCYRFTNDVKNIDSDKRVEFEYKFLQ